MAYRGWTPRRDPRGGGDLRRELAARADLRGGRRLSTAVLAARRHPHRHQFRRAGAGHRDGRAEYLIYCGKPFRALEDGQWIDVYGWLDRRAHEFPRPVGRACSAAATCRISRCCRCVIPASGRRASMPASPASPDTSWSRWLAQKVKDGRLKSAQPFANTFLRVAPRVQPLVSDTGGMFIRLEGLSIEGGPLRRRGRCWPTRITAHNSLRTGDRADQQDCRGFNAPAGATACMGLLTLDEILEPLKGLRIREIRRWGHVGKLELPLHADRRQYGQPVTLFDRPAPGAGRPSST